MLERNLPSIVPKSLVLDLTRSNVEFVLSARASLLKELPTSKEAQ